MTIDLRRSEPLPWRWIRAIAESRHGHALVWNKVLRINRRLWRTPESCRILPTLNGRTPDACGMNAFGIASIFGWGLLWGFATNKGQVIIDRGPGLRRGNPLPHVRRKMLFGRIEITPVDCRSDADRLAGADRRCGRR